MVSIVSRAQWGARPPKAVNRIPIPTPRLWVHHTADENHGAAGVRAIQDFHMDVKGWNDIAYSFLVDDDGTIYEGRGVGVQGGHTEGDNTESHAICLMGNFENREPTRAAIDSLVELAAHGRDQGWWVPTLGGHRDAPGASTACPGRHLYARLPEVRARVSEEDDMPLNETDKTIIRNIIRQELYGDDAAHSKGLTPVIRNEVRAVLAEDEHAAALLEQATQGTYDAIVKGGRAESSARARAWDGFKRALDDPEVQEKLRSILSADA